MIGYFGFRKEGNILHFPGELVVYHERDNPEGNNCYVFFDPISLGMVSRLIRDDGFAKTSGRDWDVKTFELDDVYLDAFRQIRTRLRLNPEKIAEEAIGLYLMSLNVIARKKHQANRTLDDELVDTQLQGLVEDGELMNPEDAYRKVWWQLNGEEWNGTFE